MSEPKFIFNNPDFDPSKIKPLNLGFSKGMSPEEHIRLVQAGLSMLGVKPSQATSEEQFIALALGKVQALHQYFQAIDAEVRAAGKEHNHKQLSQEMTRRIQEAFGDYGKDELLAILTVQLASQIRNSIL